MSKFYNGNDTENERLTERITDKNKKEILAYRVKCNKDLEVIQKLGKLEDMEEDGDILIPPCGIWQTVYVLTECEKIPTQLDGTLYSEDGSHGTATGYYCPYEYDCPFHFDDGDSCEIYEKQTAIFEDTVKSITYDECGIWIGVENCCMAYYQIGIDIFLTKSEAESALQKTNEMEGKE